MDKNYLSIIDSCHAAATLATMIAVNACQDERMKKVADNYLEDLEKEIFKARAALGEVLKYMQHEIHDDYRYPRMAGNISK